MNKKRIIIYIIIAAVIIIAATVGVVAVATSHKDKNERKRLERTLENAEKYLLEMDYEKAILEYEAAIEIDENCVEAYLGLADSYAGTDNFDKAIEILEEGYKITGDERIEDKLKEMEGTKNLMGILEDTPAPTNTSTPTPEPTLLPTPTEKLANNEENYAEIIDKYKEVIANDFEYDFVYDLSWEYLNPELINEGNYDNLDEIFKVCYAFYDLNHDGIDEMLIGAGRGDADEMSTEEGLDANLVRYNLFTFDGEKPVCIVEAGYRNYLYILKDDTIVTGGSGGWDSYGLDYNYLDKDNNLILTFAFGLDSGIPYYEDSSGNRTEVTEEDISALYDDTYANSKKFIWTEIK